MKNQESNDVIHVTPNSSCGRIPTKEELAPDIALMESGEGISVQEVIKDSPADMRVHEIIERLKTDTKNK